MFAVQRVVSVEMSRQAAILALLRAFKLGRVSSVGAYGVVATCAALELTADRWLSHYARPLPYPTWVCTLASASFACVSSRHLHALFKTITISSAFLSRYRGTATIYISPWLLVPVSASLPNRSAHRTSVVPSSASSKHLLPKHA